MLYRLSTLAVVGYPFISYPHYKWGYWDVIRERPYVI